MTSDVWYEYLLQMKKAFIALIDLRQQAARCCVTNWCNQCCGISLTTSDKKKKKVAADFFILIKKEDGVGIAFPSAIPRS